MKPLLAIIIAASAASAHARCISNDSWRGYDKNQHLAIGAVIGMAGTLQSGNKWHGFAWGTGIGALKELADSGGMGTCSLQDFAVTALGAAIGAQLGGVVLDFGRNRVAVGYRMTF